GFADVIVGASEYNWPNFGPVGRAYIYFGGLTFNDSNPAVLYLGDIAIRFGTAVAGGGDINGDGYDDVVVGAIIDGTNGRSHVFYGSPSLNGSSSSLSVLGESSNNFLGSAVAIVDLNGDGYADMVAGAPGYSSDRGRVYSFLGGRSDQIPV